MITKLIIVSAFTLVVHLIGTLAYAVRLVGVKTGRIAVSFALFNILVLVSRTANAFQAPLLAKVIESDLPQANLAHPSWVFHGLILATSVGTLIGAFLIPTFQNLLAKLVVKFSTTRSMPRLILHSFSKAGAKQFKDNFKAPSKANVNHFRNLKQIPMKLFTLHAVIIGVLSIGSFSALYAAFQNPELRLTISTLVPIVTGVATIILVTCIDPFFSLLTDDCLEGKATEAYFHKCVIFMVVSRFVGTVLAQAFLFPASKMILWVAGLL